MSEILAWTTVVVVLTLLAFSPAVGRRMRKRRYFRGRHVAKNVGNSKRTQAGTLPFGPLRIPEAACVGHFLVAGTTGSGKSLVQRRLMSQVIGELFPGRNGRALIFDAKADMAPFLDHVGLRVPAYTLNPFATSHGCVSPVRWRIQDDITSPARAMNLAATLVPAEKGGNNQYFTDAARQILTALIESFIRHSPTSWTFSDLVLASLDRHAISSLLERDDSGKLTLASFFGDDRTAYQVHTTLVSKLSYYRPVAALWQRTPSEVSIRQWLCDDSVLLLGSDATSSVALDSINNVLFQIVGEEIDIQDNSTSRRTWIWLDELRLAGPILTSGMLTRLAVKGRSRGTALVLSFQDIDGLREAAGQRIANELIAQCSHKALLRMESFESAAWASKLLGQFESIEAFDSRFVGRFGNNRSEQRVQKDAVLPSQFYTLPMTTPENGLTGYYVSPSFGAVRGHLTGNRLASLVVSESQEKQGGKRRHSDGKQWLESWTTADKRRLRIDLRKQKRPRLDLAHATDQRPIRVCNADST